MAIARYIKNAPSEKPFPATLFFILSEFIIFTLIGWIALTYGIMPKKNQSQVLASYVTTHEPSATPSPTVSPTPVPVSEVVPPPTPKKLPKNSYTIAVFGDSMVDTMGERLEYLEHALRAKYPTTSFTLYNYGQGSQTVEEGLARLGSDFHYQDRTYPPLFKTNPDIIIAGSFAYNPFTPYDRDRHWLGLTHLVQELQKISPDVYMLAEIAPLRSDFGRGPNGVNWDANTVYIHSQHIIAQLENAKSLAKVLNVPLIDAFDDSMQNGQVKKQLVNSSDGIHPSVAGHEFIAQKIVETLDFTTIK